MRYSDIISAMGYENLPLQLSMLSTIPASPLDFLLHPQEATSDRALQMKTVLTSAGIVNELPVVYRHTRLINRPNEQWTIGSIDGSEVVPWRQTLSKMAKSVCDGEWWRLAHHLAWNRMNLGSKREIDARSRDFFSQEYAAKEPIQLRLGAGMFDPVGGIYANLAEARRLNGGDRISHLSVEIDADHQTPGEFLRFFESLQAEADAIGVRLSMDVDLGKLQHSMVNHELGSMDTSKGHMQIQRAALEFLKQALETYDVASVSLNVYEGGPETHGDHTMFSDFMSEVMVTLGWFAAQGNQAAMVLEHHPALHEKLCSDEGVDYFAQLVDAYTDGMSRYVWDLHVAGESKRAFEVAKRCLGDLSQFDLTFDNPWRVGYLKMVNNLMTIVGSAIKQRLFEGDVLSSALESTFEAIHLAIPVPETESYEFLCEMWSDVYGEHSHVAIPLRNLLHFARLVMTEKELMPLTHSTIGAIKDATDRGLLFGLVGTIEEAGVPTAIKAYHAWRARMKEQPESVDHQVTVMSRFLGRALWNGRPDGVIRGGVDLLKLVFRHGKESDFPRSVLKREMSKALVRPLVTRQLMTLRNQVIKKMQWNQEIMQKRRLAFGRLSN